MLDRREPAGGARPDAGHGRGERGGERALGALERAARPHAVAARGRALAHDRPAADRREAPARIRRAPGRARDRGAWLRHRLRAQEAPGRGAQHGAQARLPAVRGALRAAVHRDHRARIRAVAQRALRTVAAQHGRRRAGRGADRPALSRRVAGAAAPVWDRRERGGARLRDARAGHGSLDARSDPGARGSAQPRRATQRAAVRGRRLRGRRTRRRPGPSRARRGSAAQASSAPEEVSAATSTIRSSWRGASAASCRPFRRSARRRFAPGADAQPQAQLPRGALRA